MAKFRFKVLSENGRHIEGAHILAFYPNGTYLETRTTRDKEVSLELNDRLIKDDGNPMGGKGHQVKLFFARDGYKALILNNPNLFEEQEIILQPLDSGGSIICVNGTGYIPNFTGRLNPILDGQGRTYLYADNIAINGGRDQAQPVRFNIGEVMVVQDKDGKALRLTVKDMVVRSSILEYEKLPEGYSLPEPNPFRVNTESDDWTPLNLGHNNPPVEEAIESLEKAIPVIEGDNEYAEKKLDERNGVLNLLKAGLLTLKTKTAIFTSQLRGIWKALKIAGQAIKEAGAISDAILAISNLAIALSLVL